MDSRIPCALFRFEQILPRYKEPVLAIGRFTGIDALDRFGSDAELYKSKKDL